MVQIKIITGEDTDQLERYVNQWISRHYAVTKTGLNIVNTIYQCPVEIRQVKTDGSYQNYEVKMHHTMVLFYTLT